MRKYTLLILGVLVFGVMIVIEMTSNNVDPMAPIALIEEGTDKCLTVYEPARNSFHACWPTMPEGVNRHQVQNGTTGLDIFTNPDLYLPER